MSHRIRYNPHLHTSQTFASLVDALDVPPREFPRFDRPTPACDQPLPIFQPAPEEVATVTELLKFHGKTADQRPLILLNCQRQRPHPTAPLE
jgi:hypothetical protein